ncbi:MAG: hypothetical protein M1827_005666 [Pycnora praestabilis]|nr:MAG: hypothetical protein M1827_005666 [Pycnora praestabilis]
MAMHRCEAASSKPENIDDSAESIGSCSDPLDALYDKMFPGGYCEAGGDCDYGFHCVPQTISQPSVLFGLSAATLSRQIGYCLRSLTAKAG